MCMHAQEVLFSNKIYKKACNILKNDHKKIVFITKCNEKNCLKRITLKKNCLQVPKMVTPPPPQQKIMVCSLPKSVSPAHMEEGR